MKNHIILIGRQGTFKSTIARALSALYAPDQPIREHDAYYFLQEYDKGNIKGTVIIDEVNEPMLQRVCAIMEQDRDLHVMMTLYPDYPTDAKALIEQYPYLVR